jgi:hypothetical protein
MRTILMRKALTATAAAFMLALIGASAVSSGRADTSPYGELSFYTEVLHIIRDRYIGSRRQTWRLLAIPPLVRRAVPR